MSILPDDAECTSRLRTLRKIGGPGVMPGRFHAAEVRSSLAGVMDDLDRRLLALLTEDARLPVKTLAGRLGVVRNTVDARLRRLRARDIIGGFTIRPGAAASVERVRAVMMVAVGARPPELVMAELVRLDGIGMVHTTNGRWDLVAELDCDDLRAFDRVLEAARRVEGVAETESCLLLTSRHGADAGTG